MIRHDTRDKKVFSKTIVTPEIARKLVELDVPVYNATTGLQVFPGTFAEVPPLAAPPSAGEVIWAWRDARANGPLAEHPEMGQLQEDTVVRLAADAYFATPAGAARKAELARRRSQMKLHTVSVQSFMFHSKIR